MRKFFDWLDRKIEYVLNVLLYAYIIVIISIEVFDRYVLHSSIVWGEETAVYAFIWLSYLSAARLARGRAHLAFTLFRDAMPRRGQLISFLVSDLCLAFLAVVVVVYMWQPLRDSVSFHQTMRGADLPIWLAMGAVPIGWLAILARVLQRAWDTISSYRKGAVLITQQLTEQV